jgi:hypothetical protein
VADYLLLYNGGKMPESEAEQAAVMKAWNDWFAQLGGDVKDGGNPFTPNAKTISADGSVGAPTAQGSGYSVIKGDSLDDAVNKAKGCPVLQGGASITVFETFEVM